MPDWFPKIFNHLLTGIVLVFIIQKMVRKPAVVPRSKDGFVLQYSRWFSGLGFGVFSIFAYLMVYSFTHREQGWQVLMGVSGFFSLLGLFLSLYGYFTKIVLEPTKLTSYAFWRAPVTLYWSDVDMVDFTGTKQFRLRSFEGQTIYVDMLIGGFKLLLDAISKNLPAERYLDAMRAYWKVAQHYEKSVGSIIAIPPAELAKVACHLDTEKLEKLLSKVSEHIEEGLGKKEIAAMLKDIKKAKKKQGTYFEKPVLFKSMPAQLFLFYYFLGDEVLELIFFAPLKLGELIKTELEKIGALDVVLEFGEDEEEFEEEESEGEK